MIDQARILSPLFYAGTETPVPSAKHLSLVGISVLTAVRLNRIWHSRLPIYETGFCLTARICFGLEYQGVLYAVAIWSNPVAPNLPKDAYLELRRYAIAPDAPRYTASRGLSLMQKHIAQTMPDVTTLVSYQDMEVHKGTIYKASNWIATGIHKGGSWSRPNCRNMTGTPRTRPDKNKAVGPKQRWEYPLKGRAK